jgi:hypothetical protein
LPRVTSRAEKQIRRGTEREREHHASIFQMWKPKKAQGFSEAVNKRMEKKNALPWKSIMIHNFPLRN